MNRRLVTLLVAVVVCGCARREAGPDAVYRQFFDALVKFSRQPYPVHQQAAWDLLSRGSQARLEEKAAAVNASLPAGLPRVEPYELLIVRTVRAGTTITAVDRTGETDAHVTLVITYDQGTDRVPMVREGGGWRVDLFGTSPADGSGVREAAAPDSA